MSAEMLPRPGRIDSPLQYGVVPLPASGAQENDIGHNLQWEAPKAVAADILSFVKTGMPTSNAYRAHIASEKVEIIAEFRPEAVVPLH